MNRSAAFIFFVAVSVSVCFSDEPPPLTLSEKIALARHLADEAAEGKAETGRVLTGNFDFGEELRKFRAMGKAGTDGEPIPEYSDITARPQDISKAEKSASEESALRGETGQKGQVARRVAEPEKRPEKIDTSKGFVNGYYMGVVGGDGSEIKEAEATGKALAEREKSAVRIYSYSGRLFELVSDDYEAHSEMIQMVRACEDMIGSYFGYGDEQLVFAKKIALQVSSSKDLKMDGNIGFNIAKNGGATLTVKWGRELGLEDFCSAFSSSVLMKLAFENGGEKASKNVPLWLKVAMSMAFEQRVRFGVSADLALAASKSPPPLPAEVFAADKNYPAFDAHAYWTLVSIEMAAGTGGELQRIMYAALAAEAPEKLSARVSGLMPASYDFALWWRCLITGEIQARLGGVMSLSRSADEIARLAVLQIDSPDSNRVGVRIDDLIKLGESSRDLLELRLLEIKVAFANINPAYHNALLALGRLYEAAADGDGDAFASSKSLFLEEFRLARSISVEIEKLMEGK